MPPVERDIALIDELRSRSAETTWIEFKKNLEDPEKIGRLVSAMSNSARLEDRDSAFIVWGVEDGTHDVVGTTFDPFF
jgi:ATP-dependent DNA helicase RecG